MGDNINNKDKKIFLINHKLFLIMLFSTSLYFFNNVYIKLLGSVSIVVLLLMTIFDVTYRMDKIKINKIWMWFLAFTFYNMILLLRNPTGKAAYSFFLQIILLFLTASLTSMSLDNRIMKKIFKWTKIFYFILLIPASIIVIFKGSSIAAGMFNTYFSHVLYKVMIACIFFFIPNSRYKFFKILFFSFIFLAIGERTLAIALLIIYTMYIVLKKVNKSQSLYKLVFIGTIIVITIFTIAYVQLQYMEIGYKINNIFREYTGGNFFSGRHRIWEVAFNYIKEAPILGYGLDNNILKSAGINLSTHNTYIHMLLQGGIIKLLIFVKFMYTIWEKYFNYLNDDIVHVSAAFLIGTLVFINFEVTLIENSVVLAMFLWFVLGVGAIQCNNNKIDELDKKEINLSEIEE